MEDVRAVGMNQNTRIVIAVIGITADVRPPVHDQDALPIVCEPLGQHATREARAHDQVVKTVGRRQFGHS